MIKKRFLKITALLLSILFTAGSLFNTYEVVFAQSVSVESTLEWPKPPEISASSAILIDADTGAILYEKDSHTKAYPASMTKILTGLLTIENCSLDEIVTFSSTAANSVKWDESNIATKAGEQFSVEQSLYALLLQSANEVAYGLAEHVAGSLSAFVDMMNAKAQSLGAINTHFSNASGLFNENHYTTAYDIAMIGRACFNNTTFTSIDSYADYYRLGPTNMTPQNRTLYGRNLMLKNRTYYYEYCKGGKTGFTDESGYTLISFAEKDGMRLICVVMKEPSAEARFLDSKSLFEYGFNSFKKVSISGSELGSLFNNSSYYYSRVFSNSAMSFSMDASYINLPANGNLSNVTLSLDTFSKDSQQPSQNYTTKLNFTYGDNIVGSTHLVLNGNTSPDSGVLLPVLSLENSNPPGVKTPFVINIWYTSIVLLVLLLILVFLYYKKTSKSYHRRRRYPRSKLHY